MRPQLLSAIFMAAAAAADMAAASSSPQTCNGFAELCNRQYSNISFIGSHDSAFVGTDLADNQNIALADQLALGVRFLQAQTHNASGVIELCHTGCWLRDAGPLSGMLATVKTFLDANPDEVVTLLLTNEGRFDGPAFDAVFREAGLDAYAFSSETSLSLEQWPTLGEMIASGKRLVVFIDYPQAPSMPYLLSEFDGHIVETPFELPEQSNLTTCAVHRPSSDTTPEGHMLLVNHWLQKIEFGSILIPNREQCTKTNSNKQIVRHMDSCRASWGKTPNFILLDFIDKAKVMAAQKMLNGLTA